ncbi:hypothetical protein [Streptomyces sp. NPDC002386]
MQDWSLGALLHLVSGEDGAYELVSRLPAELPPGRYLTMTRRRQAVGGGHGRGRPG